MALQSTIEHSANSCADGLGAPASVWALPPGGCPHRAPPSLQGPALGRRFSVAGGTPAPRTAGRHPALSIEAPRPHGMGTPAPPCAPCPAPLQEPWVGLAPSQEMPSAWPRGQTPPATSQGPGPSSSTSGQLLTLAGGGWGERNTNRAKRNARRGTPRPSPGSQGRARASGPFRCSQGPPPPRALCLGGGCSQSRD